MSLIAYDKEVDLVRMLKMFQSHRPPLPGQEVSTFEKLGHWWPCKVLGSIFFGAKCLRSIGLLGGISILAKDAYGPRQVLGLLAIN